ncbi:SRPBCC family protein [Jiulongibacter sediminis]|uniref:Activator of Hsp90 ATPase homologue 1/2-like C-terminal domain-containing protein n=1 Tax=Jiulongibacter sediminis TaxID=1605367 RepID=A0A0P7C080_9BACT|nr:SRPBCC domain-containing protein [Jiulongibacter sediminis]KPM47949.1 hypothetical protein AFM12_12055 [Jiulongibacter sediminis]TBX24131.1 hypothetical protein TK44_12065 [Jiulongibacter sediminis]
MSKPLIISRQYKHSPEKIYDAFASAEALGAWWGPAGMGLNVLAHDFTPGGKFHYTMEMGEQISYGIMEFISMKRPTEIQWLNSFADGKGNKIKPPFAAEFPLEIHNTVNLEANKEGTLLTIKGVPYNATEEEIAFFEGMFEGMNQGFSGTFDQLESYLSKL